MSERTLRYVGTSVSREDGLDKVTGAAKFAGDMRPAGTVYGKVLKPPAHGAKLKSADTSGVSEIKGAEVVREGDFIAVVHAHQDMAEKALAKIKAEFDIPKATVDDTTIFDHLLKVAEEGEDVAHEGDVKAGEAKAAEVFDQTYLNSYVAHAPMEPHTAVVQVEGKKATVWPSSQRPRRRSSAIRRSSSITRIRTSFIVSCQSENFL